MPGDDEWNCLTELKFKIDQIKLKFDEIEKNLNINKDKIKS